MLTTPEDEMAGTMSFSSIADAFAVAMEQQHNAFFFLIFKVQQRF
jgi:hypothetical protein